MKLLDEIRPEMHQRVIDLVRSTGINVGDWENCKNGATNPGANPKYCYEWAFVEPEKLVVLNLWHDEMVEEGGQVELHLNLRDSTPRKDVGATRRARRQRMENAIRLAHRSGLPIRVIVLSGERRENEGKTDWLVSVKARLLDPVSWAVARFDEKTGVVILRRGQPPSPYADQYSLSLPPDGSLGKRELLGTVRERSPEVRRYVLLRAGGKCEFCAAPGFKLIDGRIYLETHHIIPLAEDGIDSVSNVAALCPNHHREAHYSEAAGEIRVCLQTMIGTGDRAKHT